MGRFIIQPRRSGRTQFARVYEAIADAGEPVTQTEVIELSGISSPESVLHHLVESGALATNGELWWVKR